MKRPKNCSNHECAPRAWRGVPNQTGDYDLDASIMYGSGKNNPTVAEKVEQHLGSGYAKLGNRTAYGKP